MKMQEIKFKNIIIYWKGGEGKSIFCNLLVEGYDRIYSNNDFFQNWKKLNVSISNMATLNHIKYSDTPWIVIIDEWGVNLNSRRAMSKKNIEFSELLFLWRKINCYFIWISQRFTSLDSNQRELADLVIQMHKISRKGTHPIFIAMREKMIQNRLIFDAEWKIDVISRMKATWRTYNTLEKSLIN